MGDELKRGRGRPKKDTSLKYRFDMKMDADMSRRLDELTKITGMTRADIFREAFDGYEKLKRYQYEQNSKTDDFYDDFDYYDDDYAEDFDDFDE